MPYGMDKKLGGDNKSNEEWMSNCVSKVMSKDPKIDKAGAIKICKVSFQNMERNKKNGQKVPTETAKHEKKKEDGSD
jgi:hypothetical protein